MIGLDTIDKLLRWGKSREVITKRGPKMVRSAMATEEFWTEWNNNEQELRAAGLSIGRDYQDPNKWRVSHWQEVDASVLAERDKRVDMSAATSSEIELPKPEGLDYMPFQKAGVRYCLNVFREQDAGVLIGDAPGLGKTIQACGLINATPEISRILIICPMTLKSNWERELTRWLVRPLTIGHATSEFWPRTDIVIAHYNILHKFPTRLTTYWDLLVVDECFVAGTLVKTPEGNRRIEEIKPGDSVCNAAGVGIVRSAIRRKASKLVKVKTSGGEVVCTPEHPFLTQDGWVNACNLTQLHYIKSHEQTMCLLRCQFQRQAGEESVLRDILLSEVEDGATGDSSGCVHGGARSEAVGIVEAGLLHESSVCGIVAQADAGEKSHAVGISQEVSIGNPQAKRLRPSNPRRERNRTNSPGVSFDGSSNVGETEFSNPDSRQGQRISKLLQSGLGVAGLEVGIGSGRGESSRIDSQRAGQEEGEEACGARVVSVSRVERTGIEGTIGSHQGVDVFNLEVSGHPSYVIAVGGAEFVVHNCHRAKNAKARQTRCIVGHKPSRKEAAQGVQPTSGIPAKRKLMLSGTPFENRPAELWPIVSYIAPGLFSSRSAFEKRYCGGMMGSHGWEAVGATNLPELGDRLRGCCMVRRTKEEVLKELPPKTRVVIELSAEGIGDAVKREQGAWSKYGGELESSHVRIELAKASEDDAAFKAVVADLRKKMGVAFTELARVRHETALAKLPAMIELLREEIEELGTVKVVVFAHHTDVLKIAHAAFPGSVLITGDTPADERDKIVQQFQTDRNCGPFFGSIRATGEGITLTAASTVVFFENDWTASKMAQCSDRCHRIGQKDNVLVKYYILPGTIDAHMIQTWIKKEEILEQALDTEREELAAEPSLVPKAEPMATRHQLTVAATAITAAQRSAILDALRYLSEMCDGARAKDGAGFSKIDVAIGKSLALCSALSPMQAALGQKLLKKYSRQLGDEILERCGIKTKP